MNSREAIEFLEPCLQQVPRPQSVRAGMVMKRGGHLNQALKKHFVRVRRLEPHFLPMLVSLVEVSGIERIQASLIEMIPLVRIQARFGNMSHVH
jgi:hypothetical protein